MKKGLVVVRTGEVKMNEPIGYISLSRKIMYWDKYTDGNTFRLFIHLLLLANWEDKEWKGISIKRGQVITSINKLANQIQLTTQQTRTSLNKLILTNEITKYANKQYTIITIVNYEKYQNNNKQNNNENNNQITNDTTNKATTTNNIINKQYKEKYKKEILSLLLNSEFYRSRDNLKQKIEEWLNYKSERKEYYKETGFKSLLRQIEKNIETYSEESIINLIDECMANNWKGIIFDKLKDNKKEQIKEKKDPYAGVKRS